MACFFQFLFRFADGGDFRPGINDTRNGIVVDVARLPREDFRDNNTFVFRFVGSMGGTIADGVDTGHAGLEMGIDLDNAARVRFDPDGVEPKPFGIRDAADRQQDHVSLNRLRFAAGRRLDRQLHAVLHFGAGHLGRQTELDALFLENALELLRYLAVIGRKDVVEEFNDCDFRTETRPDRTKL